MQIEETDRLEAQIAEDMEYPPALREACEPNPTTRFMCTLFDGSHIDFTSAKPLNATWIALRDGLGRDIEVQLCGIVRVWRAAKVVAP